MRKIDKEYRKAYIQNEADANKYMSLVNGAAGILAIIIWILYLTKVFLITDELYPVVAVLFPCIALLMFTPLFFIKTRFIRTPGYKYFILFSLLIAISALNIAVPKHSLLFWPFLIIIATHYYSPGIGRVVFGVSLVSMLICMYLGMFFGEFDETLFGGGVLLDDGTIGTVESLSERLELLHNLTLQGNNRYFKVLVYYYFPRAMILSLFFMVSNLLNKRTYRLLDNEIKVHDEQEKSKTELGVAKEIQINTLPEGNFESEDVEIVGELKAAKEVGGDLYDYVDIDENHVATFIGDVSGKGVPAAMFMMKTLTSFRDFAAPNKTPSEILNQVNKAIFKGNKKSMFVTCFLAILDKRTGKLVYANAGHNPPIIGSNHNYHYLKCNRGLILGCFEKTFITDEETTLKPGESLILYTDGITEARNKDGAFFGEERLLEILNRYNYTCTVEVHHTIKEQIASFVKDAPQSDDITLVTLRYQGGSYSVEEEYFDGKKENIKDMIGFIEKFSDKHEFPVEFKKKLLIVGDELFTNIVNHGYKNQGGEIFVRLLFNKTNNEFALTIIDRAAAFNQLAVNNPEVGIDPKSQKVGGLGLILVKKIMDEYAYDRVNDKNILVLKKGFKK